MPNLWCTRSATSDQGLPNFAHRAACPLSRGFQKVDDEVLTMCAMGFCPTNCVHLASGGSRQWNSQSSHTRVIQCQFLILLHVCALAYTVPTMCSSARMLLMAVVRASHMHATSPKAINSWFSRIPLICAEPLWFARLFVTWPQWRYEVSVSD